MGQYFILVNVDKKEVVYPGMAKIGEDLEIAKAALVLMAAGDDDGGALRGPWAADHVIYAGDYDSDRRYTVNGEKTNLYHLARAEFKDVTDMAAKLVKERW